MSKPQPLRSQLKKLRENKKLLIIIVTLLIVLLLAAATCVIFFTKQSHHAQNTTAAEMAQSAGDVSAQEPLSTQDANNQTTTNEAGEETKNSDNPSSETTNPAKKSGGKSSSNPSGSSTTDTGGYDRSHPVVAAALALVGRKNMICDDVVCHAIQTSRILVKTVYTNTLDNSHRPLTDNINATHTFQLHYEYLGTSETPNEGCSTYVNYIVTNNIITGHTFTRSPKNCLPTVPDPSPSKANQNLGKTVYEKQTVSPDGAGCLILMQPPFAYEVPFANRKPGDILDWDRHVAVYIGNSKAVHGGWNGTNVVIAGDTLSSHSPSTPQVWRLDPNYKVW